MENIAIHKVMKFDNYKDVLKSTYTLNNFIYQLCNYGLDNCSGSSFKEIRSCYYKNGILLKSEHRANNCGIYVSSVLGANIINGCQNFCTYGDPNPTLSEGVFIPVWDDGKWIKKSPWIEKIHNLINELCDELNQKIMYKYFFN